MHSIEFRMMDESCEILEIPEGVTEISPNAFQRSSTLKSVTIPGSVRMLTCGLFDSCRNLESVSLNEGLGEICDFAFSDCISLREITIPKSVEWIGNRVFARCTNMSLCRMYKTTAVGNWVFSECAPDFRVEFID